MLNQTQELLLELNKIEEERIKKEEKERQFLRRQKLEKEKEELKELIDKQEYEIKNLQEEENIKKENEYLRNKLENIKNEKINVFIDEEPCENRHVEINKYNNKEIINVEVICKNKKIHQPLSKNNKLNYIISAILGSIITYFFINNINQDDGVVLKLEHPKIMLMTQVVEKEVIVEKEVKPLNVVKQQNTKPQNNTTIQTNTKPKQKCPVSDPLCGIF